ncbi:PEP-CTERM sorting domain-containing protein [Crocosphaera sp. XPORK-15E]|uniref:PEP-CTERM sorting domain-containing protein n=1 Tax=Crocosphaera sp. XPORK-15E TaxID=3110247 RepID=UPI002B1ED0A6|nr:PEP-CTERM sorting domain-containing protein [Crocosphaera sp. XPORK-15E]MEA5537389.1 PEP-CTERM sorting domain-containing protein [Crocosphaera sp. XPORK-15E]
MNQLLAKIIATAAATTTLSVAIAQQAQAISFNFSWQGDGGYSAQGMFGYDETTAPAIIAESGAGATNDLQFLMVSFFDSANNPLQSFNTVVNGVSESPFFAFNFDTSTQTLFGAFDVGGGTGVIGEQFFGGTIGGLLTLNQDVNQVDQFIELDRQDPGVITVTEKVPEPSSILGLLALGMSGVGSLVKKKESGNENGFN